MELKSGTRIRIQVRNRELFYRIRKAVWKEKDIDPIWVSIKNSDGSIEEVKRKSLYRLHCEFYKEDGIMVFFVSELLTPEDV